MALAGNWDVQVLQAIGAPVTPANRKFLRSWQRWEGGGSANEAHFNPLNTTTGSAYPAINSVGVRAFPNAKVGTQATAKTLLNGRYPNIVQGLRGGNPYAVDVTSDLSTWVSGRPDSQSGAKYAARVLGTRVAAPPVPSGVRRQARPRAQQRLNKRVLAQGFIGMAMDYANTGEVNSDAVAKLTNAVSRAGTVEPPVAKGKIPGSKGRGDLGNGMVDKVLAAAHTQVGKPYVFGSGPNTDSFDCSDLVQWAYKQVGIDIPRTTYDQMKVLPKKPWNKLAPGDLIYRNNGGHVVMYVGGGKVIAAPYTGTVVQYQPLSKFQGGDYHVRSVM